MNLRQDRRAIAALAVATPTVAADGAPGGTDWDKLPGAKRPKVGL